MVGCCALASHRDSFHDIAGRAGVRTSELPKATGLLSAARRLADDVLFERALAVDAADSVPEENLDLLRDAGLYGLWSPTELGGCGFDEAERLPILEALASGCLTTAFVWAQHGGGSANAARTPAGSVLHERWARALATGERRSGVAFAHVLRAEPCLFAERAQGGWVLRGVAPFVTGWGHIDAVLVAAHEADRLVWMLISATEAPHTAVSSATARGCEFNDHGGVALRRTRSR